MTNLTLNADTNLKIILPHTNKALALALKDASSQELQTISQTKDLSSILNAILKQTLTADDTQNRALLELLKNNPTLKSLSNAVPTIKELLLVLKQDKNPSALEKTLQNFLSNIKEIHPKELQSKLENSGVFLESKIKNTPQNKELFASDLKALLLNTQDELKTSAAHPKTQEALKLIDKLTLQIDYHQILSHLSNAASIYIPYSWNELKDGHINIHKTKEKNSLCDIHLELKEYGVLDLRLALFETNRLNINISTESKELKNLIVENMPRLKKQLINAAITPQEIRFVTESKNSYTDNADDNLAMGFEVKV